MYLCSVEWGVHQQFEYGGCCDCTGCQKIVKAGVVCSPVVLSAHPFAMS